MLARNIQKLLAFVGFLTNSCYLSTFPMYRNRCALGIKPVYSQEMFSVKYVSAKLYYSSTVTSNQVELYKRMQFIR